MAPATSAKKKNSPTGFPSPSPIFPLGEFERNTTLSLSKYEKTEGIDPVTVEAEAEGDLDLWANRFFLPSSERREGEEWQAIFALDFPV